MAALTDAPNYSVHKLIINLFKSLKACLKIKQGQQQNFFQCFVSNILEQ